jgi:DnaJ-class molecular chaperone
MTCACIQCDECHGTGTVWISFSGKYLGSNRCDDLDSLETCDECGGRGLSEICAECQEKEDAADQEEFEAYQRRQQPVEREA